MLLAFISCSFASIFFGTVPQFRRSEELWAMPFIHSFAMSLYQIGGPFFLAGYSRPETQYSEFIIKFEIMVFLIHFVSVVSMNLNWGGGPLSWGYILFFTNLL